MAIDRSFRAKLRYKSDEFLGGGAGRQLLFLFVLVVLLVAAFACIGAFLSAIGAIPEAEVGSNFLDKTWFYFTRVLDAGTMGGDADNLVRFLSTLVTLLGVVIAGLLISSLAGNFQERLDQIKHGGAPVMEEGHFLILGWSEKIYSVIDQLSEAYLGEGRTQTVVVMADRPKLEMEDKLRDKVQHLGRVKIVVRQGSSVALNDLSRVSFDHARAIVVLVDDADAADPNKADGRVIKTLMALFNHPDGRERMKNARVTAEVMLAQNQDIGVIASNGRAQVIKTNEIISKILLQTARIGGLSLVYDELLRFEGNEIHYKHFPEYVGRAFGDILLDFPNGLLVGTAKLDGTSHILNNPADHVIAADEALLILAEDANVEIKRYQGPLRSDQIQIPPGQGEKRTEHMLVLGWNPKIFPVIEEFDSYVGPRSTITLVNSVPIEERMAMIAEKCPAQKNTEIRHLVGEFTNRNLMDEVQPQHYPTVMVLGDSVGVRDAEDADTRAIIALLLLRDASKRAGKTGQEICSEILDPKNRELAATTEIHDIVISNEMVSMVLAQITYEPRVRPVLEDLFRSEGSEIYLKSIDKYVPLGAPCTFEHLVLAAKARGEVAMGVQIHQADPSKRYGMMLNPKGAERTTSFSPKDGDRLIVLAEEDG